MFVIAAMFAWLMLLARLIRLAVARIVVAWHERLLLHRHEPGSCEMRKALALVVAVVGGHLGIGARLRLVLAEMFLGRGDQAEIMLCMLIVVFGRDRIAGRARIARQLHVFFGNVGCGAAGLMTVGPLLENSGHRVLAAPATIVIVAVIRLRIRLLF